jgi:hypothetical protein
MKGQYLPVGFFWSCRGERDCGACSPEIAECCIRFSLYSKLMLWV